MPLKVNLKSLSKVLTQDLTAGTSADWSKRHISITLTASELCTVALNLTDMGRFLYHR